MSKHLGTLEERVSAEIALKVIIYRGQKCSQIAKLLHVLEGKRE